MKNIFKFLFLTVFVSSYISCENDEAIQSDLNNFVGIEALKNVGVELNQQVTVGAKVYASNAVGADRVFNLVVDATSTQNSNYYSVPATVTIPAGSLEGNFQVSITGTDIASAGNTLIVGLEQSNAYNQSTSFTVSNAVYTVTTSKLVINISEVCQAGTSRVKLSITFDNYPEETAWELYDANFQLISSGGFDAAGAITGYAALGFADRSTYVNYFCLAPGSYNFVIYDAYGDGMYTSATVSGSYSLSLGDGTILTTGGGDFGDFEVKNFTVN